MSSSILKSTWEYFSACWPTLLAWLAHSSWNLRLACATHPASVTPRSKLAL
jgi:hypothetical protein